MGDTTSVCVYAGWPTDGSLNMHGRDQRIPKAETVDGIKSQSADMRMTTHAPSSPCNVVWEAALEQCRRSDLSIPFADPLKHIIQHCDRGAGAHGEPSTL